MYSHFAVSWFKNSVLVQESARSSTSTQEGGVCLLSIQALQAEDAGLYSCVATNELGTERCDCSMRVLLELELSAEGLLPAAAAHDTTGTCCLFSPAGGRVAAYY